MPGLPTGTVTFLFTDIEGSTRLLQQLGDRYADVLADCRRLVRMAVQERGGQEVDTEGDAVFAAFPSGREALVAAVTAQQNILRHSWPNGASLRVRMGLHTGEARVAEGGYVGLDVHRAARIAAAAQGGQVLVSDVTHALVVRDLPEGLSLRDLGEHRLRDLAHPHRLFQVLAPDLPADFPPLRSLDAHLHNLPIQLTSFIGRGQEIAEVKRLLGDARLVTLTGSGGAGKTRLALQVTADVVEAYPDGVWLTELAPLADPVLVPKTVALALNVPEQPSRDMTETLVDALRPKNLLLVLDNCEHLLAACRNLTATLLRKCPKVRILATSREGLGIPGEISWRVPSLSLPKDISHLTRPEELVLYDAVRLFADRAAATVPGFIVTSENTPAVAQVCQRLDGIPLAIELAAARMKVLAVEQIAARLDDRFRLLTGGSQIALPRQQTLRAAIDWSYDILSETERTLFRRLSVFAGGWSLEAAEAICSGNGVEASEIMDLLTRLVDKSLVIVEIQRVEARYRLLETVRQYGGERLLEAGEAADVRKDHRDWYLKLAERLNSKMQGSEPGTWLPEFPQVVEQGSWLNRLETEHDNLRAALEWSREDTGGAEPGLRLAGALRSFWYLHGHWSEGRMWLERALAGTSDAPSPAVRSLLRTAARLASEQGDYERATALCEKGLAACRQSGDRARLGWFLLILGVVARDQGQYERAEALCEEGLNLGRDLRDEQLINIALANLGSVARHQGDHNRAATLYRESYALSQEIGSKPIVAYALRNLGLGAYDQANYQQATEFYREGLIRSREVGNRWLSRECLEGLAWVACAQGRYEHAARLLGAAEALREHFGLRRPPVDQAEHDRRVVSARTPLGETAFAATWAKGRAMTLEQAIEYALASEEASGTV